MYNSPITLIENISNQIMIERENAITTKISEQIGIDIDKEELIKAMNYDRNQYEKGYADAKAEYEQKWISVRWILVSERLPEDGQRVLITCDGLIGFVKQATYNEMRGYFYDNTAKAIDFDEVIAWMPLPAPYRIESEEE